MERVRKAEKDPVLQLVTFQLGEEYYGINVMQVQEVLRVAEIAPVPGTPGYILGIVNLRGSVVTVIDARLRMGIAPKAVDDASRIVIVEANELVVGLLVDSVHEVLELRQSEIEAAPNVGSEETARYILGVSSRDDRLTIVVDIDRLISEADAQAGLGF